MGPLGDHLSLALAPPPRPLFGDAERDRGVARGWDLLASVPVPLRHRVRDGVADLLAREAAAGRPPLHACFPLGQGGRSPFDRLRYIRRLDDYPEMLVSADGGNAFNRRFHDRHVLGGAFESAQPAGAAEVFTAAGLVDPLGRIGVFAVAPFVMLIDRRRLGERPVPRAWGDLLDPVFRDEIVLGGWRRPGVPGPGHYNRPFLLAILRAFGLTGLRRFVANLGGFAHSAQMPRLAGTESSPGAVMILPWSLADLCPRRRDTEVIWPADGAFAYPLWLTLKGAARRRMAPLAAHFHGADLAHYLNANLYPALCPAVTPRLPAGGRLDFVGWDYLRHPQAAADWKTAGRLVQDKVAARGEGGTCG